MNPKIAALACWLSLGVSTCFAEFAVDTLDEGLYYGVAPTTAADFQLLHTLGVRHVIDIRTFNQLAGSKEELAAGQFGMKYQRIPTGFFPTLSDGTERVMQIISNRPCGPVYVHCHAGKDRTGLVVALYRVRQLGWQPIEAYFELNRDRFNGQLKDLDRYFWRSITAKTPAKAAVSESVTENAGTL